MDKNKELQIYKEREFRLQESYIAKRKLVQSRMLKISASSAAFSYELIGRTLYLSEELQKSLFPHKRVIIINPRNMFAQNFFAFALLKLGKEKECLSAIKKALLSCPNYRDIHDLITEILTRLNRLEDLPSFYQEVSELIDKESAFGFYFHSAENLENSRMVPQALEQYKKAFETGAMKPGHHIKYADILTRERRFEEAIEQFKQAWELGLDDVLARDDIASLNSELENVAGIFEFIIELRLKTNTTFPYWILTLSHLGKSGEFVETVPWGIFYSFRFYQNEIKKFYEAEFWETKKKLKRDDLDEEARELYTKRLKALNNVLSFVFDSPQKEQSFSPSLSYYVQLLEKIEENQRKRNSYMKKSDSENSSH